MTTSAILGIPYIANQQSTPEVTHNDAINMLQILLAGGAIAIGQNSPPGSPSNGDIYVVGDSPTGAWLNRENCIAGYLSSQWYFIPGDDSNGTPITMGEDQEGLRIWSKADNDLYVWTDKGVSPSAYSWVALGL